MAGTLKERFKDVISDDVWLEIGSGRILGLDTISVVGENRSIPAGATETLWDNGGGIYSYLTSAEVVGVSSDSVDDAAGEIGVQSVRVIGLDEDWRWTAQDVILNGETQVLLPTPLLRVIRFYALLVGSSGEAQGNIYVGNGAVVSGVPAVKYSKIAVGPPLNNQSLMGLFAVPMDWTAYIVHAAVSVQGLTGPASAPSDFSFLVRPNVPGLALPFRVGVRAGIFNTYVGKDIRPILKLISKTDFETQVENRSNATVTASVQIDMIWEKDNLDVPDLIK